MDYHLGPERESTREPTTAMAIGAGYTTLDWLGTSSQAARVGTTDKESAKLGVSFRRAGGVTSRQIRGAECRGPRGTGTPDGGLREGPAKRVGEEVQDPRTKLRKETVAGAQLDGIGEKEKAIGTLGLTRELRTGSGNKLGDNSKPGFGGDKPHGAVEWEMGTAPGGAGNSGTQSTGVSPLHVDPQGALKPGVRKDTGKPSRFTVQSLVLGIKPEPRADSPAPTATAERPSGQGENQGEANNEHATCLQPTNSPEGDNGTLLDGIRDLGPLYNRKEFGEAWEKNNQAFTKYNDLLQCKLISYITKHMMEVATGSGRKVKCPTKDIEMCWENLARECEINYYEALMKYQQYQTSLFERYKRRARRGVEDECLATTLDAGGPVCLLTVYANEHRFHALVDTGASRSFAVPSVLTVTKWATEDLDEPMSFVVATGEELRVHQVVKQAELIIGDLVTRVDLLIASTPYSIVLGTDWLKKEAVIWDFIKGQLVKIDNGRKIIISVDMKGASRKEALGVDEEQAKETADKRLAEEAREQMEKEVEQLEPAVAEAFVRPAPKKYKKYKRLHKMVPIKKLLEELNRANEQGIGQNGLQLISVDREIEETESDLPLQQAKGYKEGYAAGMRHASLQSARELDVHMGIAVKDSSVPTYFKFEAWVEGAGRECPTPVKQCVCQYKEIFRDSLPPGLPPERIINHTITLVPGKLPSKGAVYRLGPEELQAQRQILEQLKEAKWITMTSSPFAAPSMLVSKKDDGSGTQQYRMVINYQELNSMTISPEYPLPTIQEILDMLHGAKVFTTIDMEQGFHQIRVDPKDQYKTAFRTCMGQYEFKVMPFGLRGAPGTFQAVMNHMFFRLLGRGVIAYLDDLLVYSPDVASHVRILDKVLKILRDHKMYPKVSKCNFGASSIEYLGYKVGADGVVPSPSKVQAVSIWPETLHNDSQVKQFLGTVNYCRMFMGTKFAEIARPLVELTKKGNEFKWTDEHTAAIRALKDKLINYVTLQIPDSSKPFVIKTDASGYAVGAVLEQEGKPLGFLSKKMTPAEQRYSTYDQELLAIIRALEKWRRLLLSADVTVYTDHRALQYLQQARGDKYVRGRVARWLIFLADFQNLKIKYHAGTSNVIADGLSRHPMHDPTKMETEIKQEISSTTPTVQEILFSVEETDKSPAEQGSENYHQEPVLPQPPSPAASYKFRVGGEQWLNDLKQCPIFGGIYMRASQHPGSVLYGEVNSVRFRVKATGNLLLIHHQGLWRICVPSTARCKQHVLYQFHDHPTAGHMGVHKTYDMLARLYYWPGIRAYARTYVESCPRCRAAKSISSKPAGLLQSLQIPARRWANVSLDFITGLPETDNKHDAILTLVDTISKMAHFIPTQTTVTAEGVVSLLADRLVRYHGLPAVLISDRDPRFTAKVWELFCQRFDIKRALSSSWHPESDGQTERVHRTLEQVLRAYIQSDEKAWEDLLPAAELAYNCTVHNSTGLTPFEVMIGENPLRAADLDIVEEMSPITSPPMTKLFQQLVDRAATHIMEAQAAQQHWTNKHRRDVQFKVGDRVWLSTRYIQPRGSAKFQARFIGPFPIIAKIGKAAYRLKLPPSMTQHPVFHVSLLQRDKPRPQDMGQAQGWDPLERQQDDHDPVYEVEHILDSRETGHGEEFLIKWKGFPDSAATWEPLEHLDGCKDLLRAYRASKTRQASRKQRK